MMYFFVLMLSVCSLVYEFLLSTLSSYLIWNSVLQFSLTIWLFLSWIWLGSYLSRFVLDAKKVFYYSEITLWLVWGFSVFFIKFLYIYFFNYLIVFYCFYVFIVILIWSLVWLEIPILWNLVSQKENTDNKWFKKLISEVFTYDYIWAIFATFAFPFLLLPFLWLTYTALALWLFNLLVAFLFINDIQIKQYYIENKIYVKKTIYLTLIIILYIIWGYLIKTNFETYWDHFYYKEPVVVKKQSKYQEIVITKRWDDIRLMLDWHLQFLSLDEKRYHNSLWWLAESVIKKDYSKNNILVLGWWDGLLTRNIINSFWENKFNITVIDLDKDMTDLAKTNEILLNLNQKSFLNKNVSVINMDAFKYLSDTKNKKFDFIIADFTDPRDVWVAKLYSKEFYLMIKSKLNDNWIFVTQSWNAFFAKESFWCINKTLNEVFKDELIIPYKTYIPSFGDWWFNAVIKWKYDLTDFYNNSLITTKFDDDYKVNLEKININTIEKPSIIQYYTEWRKRFNL